MSIQQNFPAISPSLNLNFARSKTLDPRITFSRTSTATRVNEQGLVEVMSADIPRFDHEYDASTGVVKSLGLLVEESRSNLLTYSEQFDNAVWSKLFDAAIDDNSATAPNGEYTADKLKNDTTASETVLLLRVNKSLSAGAHTLTVYAKQAELRNLMLRINGSTDYRANCDITTGDFNKLNNPVCSIVFLNAGWVRVSMTAPTLDAGSVNIEIWGRSGSSTSTGGVDSFTAGDGIYIWGAQLEEGSFPTSYIPRPDASTATRNPDNVSMEDDNFSDVYNQEEGSYKVEGVINGSLPANTYGGIFGAGGGSGTSNFIYYNPGTSFGQYVSNTSQSPASTLGKAYTVGSKFKISASYATNDFACSLNGDISTSTTSNALYKSHTHFRIGSNPISFAVRGAMTISNISYYSKQIKDTQLKTLTK